MAQKILDVLMLGRCSHEFSWPRRSADGHYYQVCLLCAAEYKYDWKSMRRIERVEPATPESTATRRGRSRRRSSRGLELPHALVDRDDRLVAELRTGLGDVDRRLQ